MNLYDELIIILQDGKELGFTYDEIDDIIKALTNAKKEHELLGLYRKTTLQGKYEDVMMIAKLEEELK